MRRLQLGGDALVPALSLCAALALSSFAARAAGTVGTTLPADFPVIVDASLGVQIAHDRGPPFAFLAPARPLEAR